MKENQRTRTHTTRAPSNPKVHEGKKTYSGLTTDKKFMRQGSPGRRPITDPSFFLKEKLEWMERIQY